MNRSSFYLVPLLLLSTYSLKAAQQLETTHPSTYELACISDYVYCDNIQKGMTVRNNQCDMPYELSDWKVIETFVVEKQKWGGYRGILCYHTRKKQVVFAHRGTKISNLDSLKTDLLAITFGFIEGQAGEIDPFIESVLQYTEQNDASLYITGHSLGGWLAQVTKFILQTKYKDNDAFKNIKQKSPIRCITFDTPGAAPALEHFGKEYANSVQSISQHYITNYLSAPNPVNSCRQHAGSCYRVIFDFPENKIVNLTSHSLGHFIKCFYTSCHPYLHQIEKWPIIFPSDCFEKFIQLFQKGHQNNTQASCLTQLWNTSKETGVTVYKTFDDFIKYTCTKDTINHQSQEAEGMVYQAQPYTDNAPHHSSIHFLIQKTPSNAYWRIAEKATSEIYNYVKNNDFTLKAPSSIGTFTDFHNNTLVPINDHAFGQNEIHPTSPNSNSSQQKPPLSHRVPSTALATNASQAQGGGFTSLLTNATVVGAGLNALGKGFEMGSAIARVYEQKEIGKNIKIQGDETRKTAKVQGQEMRKTTKVKGQEMRKTIELQGQERRFTMQLDHIQKMEITTKQHENKLDLIAFVTENKTALITHHNQELRKTEEARFQHTYDLEEEKYQHTKDQITHAKQAKKELIKYEYDHQVSLLKMQYAHEAHKNDEDAVKQNPPSYSYYTYIKRETLLSQIQNYFCPQKENQAKRHSTRYLTLYGWIGSGKTNLALRYAHDHFKAPYTMVWWIDANSEKTIHKSYKKILHQFGDKDAHKESSIIVTKQKLHFKNSKASNKEGKRWLVVWDNVNLDSYKEFQDDEKSEIYPSTGGDIIITTRNLAYARGKTIFVDAFTTEEAKKAFTKYREPRNKKDTECMQRLIHNFHALPLAITEAGEFIEEASKSFEEYINTTYLETNTTPSNTEKTLQQAFNHAIDQLPDSAQELLHIVAYFDFTALPTTLIKKIIKNEKKRDTAIIACKASGLLYTHSDDHDLLTTHPLYQIFLRYQHQIKKEDLHIRNAGKILVKLWKENPKKFHQHLHTYWDNLKKASEQPLQESKEEKKEEEEDEDEMAFVSDSDDDDEQKSEEKPCLLSLVTPERSEKIITVLLPKMTKLIYHYLSCQPIAYENALSLLLSTIQAANATKKATSKDLQQLYSYLGDTLLGLNRIEEATQAYEQALAYDQTQAVLHDNLARCYLTTKQIEKAEKSYQTALELQKKQHTYHGATAVNIYFTLAQHYEEKKDRKKAIAFYDKTVEEKEADTPIIQQANLSLALLYQEQSQAEKAAKYYRQCLQSKPSISLTITAHLGLSRFYKEKSQYPLAYNHLNNAWDRASNYWGKQAPTTLQIRSYVLDLHTQITSHSLQPTISPKELLEHAVTHGQYQATNYLLQQRSDRLLTTQEGDTLLRIISKKGHIHLLPLFLQEATNQMEENDEKINMLDQEINKKDKKIADFQSILRNIPKQRLDDNAKKELFRAIERNNLNKVELFLKTYKDVVNARDNEYRTPFLRAAQSSHLRILKLLKAKGADVNATNKYYYNALEKVGAVVASGTTVVAVVAAGATVAAVAAGATDLDISNNNALHFACKRSGNLEMVTWLIDVCDLPLEAKGGVYKRTPFLFAAYWGNLNVLKVLKAKDADVKAVDSKGNNALRLACKQRQYYSEEKGGGFFFGDFFDMSEKQEYNEVINYLKSIGCR